MKRICTEFHSNRRCTSWTGPGDPWTQMGLAQSYGHTVQ